MKKLSPYKHVLNASGTACEDGTSRAGAIPCPACRWAEEHKEEIAQAEKEEKDNQ
jgi:hypothetical protein